MEILRTRDSKSVYSKISSMVKSYVVTKDAKEKFSLELKNNESELRASHEKLKTYEVIDDSSLEKIRAVLSDFRLNESSNFFVDRVIATDDEEIYEKLFSLKKHCEVVCIREQGQGNFEEQGKHVVFVDYEPKIVDILPEYVLCDFIVNRSNIKKIFEIYSFTGKFKEFREFSVDLKIPGEVIDELFMFNDKIEVESAEISERRKNIKNFKNIISGEAEEINSEVLKRVDARKIKVSGKKLLEMNAIVQNISELDVFREIIGGVIKEHTKKISKKFNINTSKLSGVFTDTYPCKVNDEEVKFLVNKIKEEISEEEHKFKVKLARKLEGKEVFLKEASEKIIKLDAVLAVIKFSRENKCTVPEVSESNNEIYFKNAKNLLIKNAVSEDVVPVTYSLGGEIEKRRVAILTGANSGGKTTLLKTILQMQILAQSGLPVSSEYFKFPIIDEIYFLSKHSGTLSAGAFERTLRDISKILVSNKKKLVLIDELESITEPGAAARMVSSILEMLVESGDFAVVVTHLSEEILKHITEEVRVDGITATGLDEKLNLVVDRQPKFNTIGKSTPELIVEKLYLKSSAKDKERKVYEKILGKMKEK